MRNWAGNYEYRAVRLHRPESIEELQELVRRTPRLRPLGSRHSFNDIADTDGDLVALDRLPRTVEIDHDRRTVTVHGGIRYGDLCPILERAGLALHNTASLPHISVAGAVATGTHGSGDRSGSLATAIRALKVVTADGEIASFDRGDPASAADFPGAVVSLGALGPVVRLTLDVEPTYRMRQDVYDDLPLAALDDHFDDIMAAADSVSLFTDWRAPRFHHAWLKTRLPPADPGTADAGADDPGIAAATPPPDLYGARPAPLPRHPIEGFSPEACTEQLGRPGPWHDRLPHFRLDHTPSAGAEIQSEYLLPREHAVDAIRALHGIARTFAHLVQTSEIRTVAADELWLSPATGRATVGIHFTWQSDGPAVGEALPHIERALEPFDARPHWGKVFTTAPEHLADLYARLPAFRALLTRVDPERRFGNAFLDRYVLTQH